MSTRFLTLRAVNTGEVPLLPHANQSIAGSRSQAARKAQKLEIAIVSHQEKLTQAAELADRQRIEIWNQKFQGVNPFAQAAPVKQQSRPWGGLRRIRPAEKRTLRLLAQNQRDRFQVSTLASELRLTKGVTAAALKVLVKNALVDSQGETIQTFGVTRAGEVAADHIVNVQE